MLAINCTVRKLIIMLIAILLIFVLLVAGVGLGFRVKARPFRDGQQGTTPQTHPIPIQLPDPVKKFAQVLFDNSIPEATSALVVGRARLAPTGIPLPTRFKFYYDAPHASHYHDIHITWFNRTIMRIHERNLEGHATFDLALLGRIDDAPRTNRASIQGYWAEVLAWVPSIALLDTQLHWDPLDASSARLQLPGLDEAEALTLHFDSNSGLLTTIETLRFKDEADSQRHRWRNHVLEWGTVDGLRVPTRSQTQWDDDTPWATWHVDQIVLNYDVTQRLAHFGGDVV